MPDAAALSLGEEQGGAGPQPACCESSDYLVTLHIGLFEDHRSYKGSPEAGGQLSVTA